MDTSRHWFSAKQWGFGCRLPVTWEGWLVDGVWLAAWLGMTPFMRERQHGFQTLGLFFGMLALLLAVHHWKGEPSD